MVPSIYVAGTGMHSGKTLVCLGLVAALKNRGIRVAYMKPVGQHAVSFCNAVVDEDVALMQQVFRLPTAPAHANPVTIPHGYTRKFLSEGQSSEELISKISEAYESVCDGAELVVVEGTGHAGVGAVVGLSNARVARLLGSRAVIVAGGGIGRPVDEFYLNRALFEQQQVPVLGMISNKIRLPRLEELTGLLSTWVAGEGCALFGMMPYAPVLSEITLTQIVQEIGARVISGADALQRKMRTFIIGAGPCHRVLRQFEDGVLLITDGDRDDLVLGAVSWDQAHSSDIAKGIGVCLTADVLPQEDVLSLAVRSRVPVIAASGGTCEVGTAIRSLVAKILADEQEKIDTAQRLVDEYVDVDALLAALNAS